MRRFGNPPRPDKYYRPRPGAYAIILRGDKILLTEQSEPRIEIQLPGGGIDAGEGPLMALHREAYEETGWKIEPVRRLGTYQRFTYMPEYDLYAQKIAHIYLCNAIVKHSDPIEPFHRAIWSDIDTAINLLGPEGDRHFLKELVSSR
ncbi:MAG: NUDIX hydrolase [Rhodobacteraceae bacterium]|nr:NUDIX hydrolase [Paracoccaceae bacterium]